VVRWSVVDELTEDFLEEYGWRRLFRELAELKKCEIVVKVQSTELKANAQAVRDRMDMHRAQVTSTINALKDLGPSRRKELALMTRDVGKEAVGCATMTLVRGEPSWDEMLCLADEDALIGRAVGCDPEQLTPGMLHRLNRLSARHEFDEVVRAHREGIGDCPYALGLLAEWILACQDYASTARELGPRQELVDKAEQSLPHRVEEYRQARESLENVIGNGCFLIDA